MAELSEDRYRQLINICLMHYEEGLTQQEIADRVGISRPQISRMLASARNAGIVKIVVENPFSEEYHAEKALQEMFGLQNVTVVSAPNVEKQLVLSKMAMAVAAQFESCLKDGSTLGILSGNTIYGISKDISLVPRKNLTVVSLSGGSERAGYQQANNSAHYFADKFACRFYPLHAPLVVANPEVKALLIEEQEIARTIESGRNADVALVGIGRLDATSPYFGADVLTMEQMNKLKAQGAVAGLSGSLLNENGELVPYPESSRIMAISLPDLKRIPKVIAVAYGKEKVDAIRAVLTGGWVNILITTLETANDLIQSRSKTVKS